MFFKVPTSCTLWVAQDGEKIRVASGRVHPTGEGDLIHNEPLPADCYKVCLELVHDGCGDYAVPHPVEDEPAVAKHLGFFLKWPRALVSFSDKVLCKQIILICSYSLKIIFFRYRKHLCTYTN